MKKKLRELRKKREFVKLCKGALKQNYVYGVFKENCTFKKKGNKTNFKKGVGFIVLYALAKKINCYSKSIVKAKAKKRGGKNVI